MHSPLANQVSRKPIVSAVLASLWAFGRVLLLLAAVFLLRKPLLDAIEATFDIVGVTEFVIDRAGTPLTRFLVAVSATAGFFIGAKLLERFIPQRAYLASLVGATLFTAIFVWKAEGGFYIVALVAAILATNWARLTALRRIGLGERGLTRLVAIPPAVGEVFFASRYLNWVGSLLRRAPNFRPAEAPRLLPGALIAALALATLIPGQKLMRYEQALRSGSDVRVFARGDFNDIVFDAREKRLFVTGHGVKRVLGFDTEDLTERPIKANVETGAAQAFEYDPEGGELYIYNSKAEKILVLENRALTLKRTIDAPDISPGDPWIKYCPKSGTLTIASEADQQRGDPFVVFDHESGQVLDKCDLEAGNLLVHPEKPILYANFFRRLCGVVAYDLEKRTVMAKAPTDARTDRMAFDPVHGELLMASPAEGRIQRFDALTLRPKGALKSILGVRVIAVDAPNDVMLVGSLITGRVALMGLADRTVKKVWYLGPWLRSIVIAPGTGIAYVSSQKALYELHYSRSH